MSRPSGAVLRDGGFHRTYQVLTYLSDKVDITLIDRYPSGLRAKEGLRIVEYKLPFWVGALRARLPNVGRAVEVLATAVAILLLGQREVRRHKHAAVYVPVSELAWLTIPAYLISKSFRKSLILVNHNTKGGGPVRWLLWRIHQRADRVIAVSSAIKEELQGVGVSRRVATNGCGFDRTFPDEGARGAIRWDATYVGRLEPEKGMNDLVEVWSLVAKKFVGARLLLVGFASPSNRRRILNRQIELRLQGQMVSAGVLSDADKFRALSESRICLFLSRAEGWGLVPIEALSMGLPVVVYDLPCYRESLDGLYGVFRVPFGDVAMAAKQVERLLALDAPQYSAMTYRIKSTFRYQTWSEVANRELSLIGLRNSTLPSALR